LGWIPADEESSARRLWFSASRFAKEDSDTSHSSSTSVFFFRTIRDDAGTKRGYSFSWLLDERNSDSRRACVVVWSIVQTFNYRTRCFQKRSLTLMCSTGRWTMGWMLDGSTDRMARQNENELPISSYVGSNYFGQILKGERGEGRSTDSIHSFETIHDTTFFVLSIVLALL